MEPERTGRIQRNTGGCLSQGSLVGSCPQIAAGSCSSATLAATLDGSWRRVSWNRHRVVKLNLELCFHLAATCGEGKRCSEPSLLSLVKNLQQLTFHFLLDQNLNQRKSRADRNSLFTWKI